MGYFAFFVRNEIRAYSPDGALLWRTTRTLDYDTYEPIFTGAGENLRYNMRPVTQALAVGPDGRLYALTVPDSLPDLNTLRTPAGHRRVEVYDPDTGALLRAAAVPADVTTFAVDGTGHVFRVDPDVIDTTAPAPERAPLPRVTLRTFDGDSATFQQYRGKALLVNFWASWCVPCQRELPELKAYYQTLDSDYVEFLAISADETPEIGRSFIEPFALPFPLFYGGAEMQERFHFIGLPYTLLVDARGRIVEEIYGFGSPETWQHLKDTLEGLIAEATPSGPAADHEHGETAADHGRGEPATDHGHGEVRPAAREP